MLRNSNRPKAISTSNPSLVPEEVVVRSLRRRLWQALHQGDSERALQVYRATRADWEQWMKHEQETTKRRPASARKSLRRNNSGLTAQPTEDSQDSTMGLLQLMMNPSKQFVDDDLLDPMAPFYEIIPQTTKPRQPKPKIYRRPKWPAASFLFLGNKNKKPEAPILEDDLYNDMYTTPLHEAGRLGCGELVRLMLEHESTDCEERNVKQRTALHMITGGVYQADSRLGIGPAQPKDPPGTTSNRKSTKGFGKLFRNESKAHVPIPAPTKSLPCSDAARLDAARAILAWSAEKDSSLANSVDYIGRSALHYAAELGREEICQEILAQFGTNLTVVDDTGKTPCELAAEEDHFHLAAMLEARTVLYMDPFGLDDDLYLKTLAMQPQDGFSRKCLAPPFAWFETLTNVQKEREARRDDLFEKMRKALLKSAAKERTRDKLLTAAREQAIASVPGSSSEDVSVVTKCTDMVMTNHFEDVANHLQSCHADAILVKYKWDVKIALTAFCQNPLELLKEFGLSSSKIDPPSDENNLEEGKSPSGEDSTCLICCDEFSPSSTEWRKLTNCQHKFCKDCLSDYVGECIKGKQCDAYIPCPHHECSAPLAHIEIAELACTSDDYGNYLESADENFVVAASDIRFCPLPGCGCAVKFCPPEDDRFNILGTVGAVCTAGRCSNDGDPLTYEGIGDGSYYGTEFQPVAAHRFCFSCGEGMHWPVPCDMLSQWQTVVKEHVVAANGGVDDGEDYQEIAQKLWMKANTRPCPKCNAPIQKNDGCNHMTCRGCRYEFCWICSGDWKLHNTDTGGFFRCNRWIDQEDHEAYSDNKPDASDVAAATNITDEELANPSTMKVTYGTAMHEAMASRYRQKEMGRFLHHYDRWNAHLESARLERKMRDTACERLAPVVEAANFFCGATAGDFNFGGRGLSFVHAAFVELLECRSALQHSYAYLFIRGRKKGSRRKAIEKVQADLEMMTEQLSDIVARSHLRASQTQILYLATATGEKRKAFSHMMVNALNQDPSRKPKPETMEENAPSALADLDDLTNEILHLDGSDVLGPRSNSTYSSEVEASSSEEIEAAIRASLEDFVANSDAMEANEAVFVENPYVVTTWEWACSACTFVNSGNDLCAVCGTLR